MIPPINYLSVIAAALVGIFLGFFWYGPLFGKTWMKLVGSTKESKSYAVMALGSLLMAYVLAYTTEFAMNYTNIYGVMGGLMSGVWIWAGFVMPVKIGDRFRGGTSWKLILLDGGYYLVSLALMGIIVATWR
ncbi:MAG: DUF1761 domain-containing protein [Patescibacteria group bacterium]